MREVRELSATTSESSAAALLDLSPSRRPTGNYPETGFGEIGALTTVNHLRFPEEDFSPGTIWGCPSSDPTSAYDAPNSP